MQRVWAAEDLVADWTLVEADRELLGNKSGAPRLGFAVLLKFFEVEARFPAGPEEAPGQAVEYVSSQVRVDAALFAFYDWSGRSIKYHRAQIRSALGFREATVGDEGKLAAWLAAEVCPVELRDEQLRAAVAARCRAERIEPPSPSRVVRVLGAARAEADRVFCARTVDRLDLGVVARLEALAADVGGSPPCSSRKARLRLMGILPVSRVRCATASGGRAQAPFFCILQNGAPMSISRKVAAFAATGIMALTGFGALATPARATDSGCALGNACAWGELSYHIRIAQFQVGNPTYYYNDVAVSIANNGRTNRVAYYEHAQYRGDRITLNNPARGGQTRDPDLRNGTNAVTANWAWRISSSKFI